jgi:hypothetical protein
MMPFMPILRLFWDICLFRKGPEDVPASSFLFGLTLLGYALLGLLLLSFQTGPGAALLQVFFELLMNLAFVALLLWTVNKPHRFPQTAIAQLGSDVVISALALPFLLAQKTEELAGLTQLPLLAMMIWHIAVAGMIFARAISKSLPIGIAVALLYTLLSAQAMAKLFPPGA